MKQPFPPQKNGAKIVAKTFEERKIKSLMPINQFRLNKWVEGGIFGDLIEDDYSISDLVFNRRFKA